MNKAVIFDKDGTLLDLCALWAPVGHKVVEYIIDKYNLPADLQVPMEESIGLLGDKALLTGELCCGNGHTISLCFNSVLKKRINKEIELNKLKNSVSQGFIDCIDYGKIIPICPNLQEVMEQLKAKGLQLFVITADDPENTEYCLDTLGITKYFDKVYTFNDKVPAKPDPAQIVNLCKEFNLKPSEITMVGDSIVDMEFAKNGGVRSIGISSMEGTDILLAEHTENVIYDFTDILKFF